MAKYRVQGPDGAIHVFEGPDNATQEQILAAAQAQFGGQKQAAPELSAAADDPGAFMAALIGAGRTTDQIIDGMKQLGFNLTGDKAALDKLRAEQEEKSRLYKPLQEQRPFATAIGEALPSAVIPVGGAASAAGNVGRLAAAGAIPAAFEYGSAGERAGRAAGGAAGGVVGGVVAPAAGRAIAKAVPAIGRTAKAVTEPLYASGREAIAGRTLNRAAGEGAQDVINKLGAAAELVPGSLPTAAQVAESGGIAALERATAAANPAMFAERGMEQAAARTGALRGIAGDDAARAAAVTARGTASGPLYKAASGQEVEVNQALQELLNRPSLQAAIARAEKIAAEEGRPFGFSAGADGAAGKITGQTLQDIKMGMDALLKDPTSGIAGKEAANIQATRGALMNWMENAIPDLRTARTTYRDMSKPISQMDIGQELLTRLEPALNDYGGLARETAAKYATALRNADQTARRATGFKGAGMADIMEPGQMRTIEAIASDLARKANAQDLGRGVGSDTFQKMAMSNIAEQSGAPGVVGGALSLPGVSKVAKFLYSEPEEKIQTLIAQSLLNPQSAAQLMQRQLRAGVPQSASEVLFANPARATQILGGGAGLSAANLFAQ